MAIGRAAVLAAQHASALAKAIWPADMVDAAAARKSEREGAVTRGGWGLGPWLRALARTEEERRAAIDLRYRWEVVAALAQGREETAERIRVEWRAWVLDGAPL